MIVDTGQQNPSGGSDVLVIGESLIDIVRTGTAGDVEVVGGSPANVALGLGRLGDTPRLMTALGDDDRGRRIAAHLAQSGVSIDPASWSLDHTSTAIATIGATGAAEYEFDVEWKLPPSIEIGAARAVHIGSIAAFLPPGADRALAVVGQVPDTVWVTFDPNIRPTLIGSHDDALDRVHALVARADLVKLSDEDAAWLWPEHTPEEVLTLLLKAGARIAAVTLGGAGALAATAEHRVRVSAPRVAVTDTVGAGDTFMAALIHRVVGGRFTDEAATLTDAVEFAATAASLTVQRAGSDLPRLADVAVALAHARFSTSPANA